MAAATPPPRSSQKPEIESTGSEKCSPQGTPRAVDNDLVATADRFEASLGLQVRPELSSAHASSVEDADVPASGDSRAFCPTKEGRTGNP
jgi:hypothetical protein